MNARETDFELVTAFVRRGNQNAFAGLVRRHADLVYATALRKVEDQGAAQEVAQNVFASLARKAWQFAADDSIPAWLFKTTLLEAKEWWRGELRRRRREEAAAQLSTTMNAPNEEPALRALVPVLDEALLSLREKDRVALLLRFYESQSLRDVGAALGVNEDTAQKRVAIALEKLTAYFQRRGFRTATAAVVAAALQQTASSAPALVVNSLAQTALHIAPPALGLLTIVARLAGLSKLQTAAVCLGLVAIPVGWKWNEHGRLKSQVREVENELTAGAQQLFAIRTEVSEWEERSIKLEQQFATAEANAADRARVHHARAEWMQGLREQLTSADYHWPEDSPFVRIPKSAIPIIAIRSPVAPPGVLAQPVRELLGLTPEEREAVEGELQEYFSTLNQAVESRLQEVDALPPRRSSSFGMPNNTVAKKMWVVPELDDVMKTATERLHKSVEETLGSERWNSAQVQEFVNSQTRVADSQQTAVWLERINDKLLAYYGYAGQGTAFTTGGLNLELFHPDARERLNLPDGTDMNRLIHGGEFIDSIQMSEPVARRIIAWIREQAEVQLAKEDKR